MELNQHGAEFLLQVITEREENNSIPTTSNESFTGWTKTFTNPRLCVAIFDLLTFKGTIIERHRPLPAHPHSETTSPKNNDQ